MPINTFNTQFIGRQFLHLPVCDSTNAMVMQKLASSQREDQLENGAILMADFQTAGRGQRNSHWDAKPGLNLTFTIALRSELDIQHQFYLNIITSLAISDSLIPHLAPHLKIKWPNDIYYLNHKLCGILIQNNLKVNMIQSSAIGIGINVNQLHFENLQATSLKFITKSPWDRLTLLKDIAQKFEDRYFQLKTLELEQLKQDYLNQLYQFAELHTFKDQSGEFEGKIVGINENGQLLVEKGNSIVHYNMKEITYLN